MPQIMLKLSNKQFNNCPFHYCNTCLIDIIHDYIIDQAQYDAWQCDYEYSIAGL
jgi:hypothetical protein